MQERPAAAPVGTTRSDPEPDDDAIKNYRIVFEPHRELFRHANEPLLIIRELKRLGELTVECSSANLPKPCQPRSRGRVSLVHFQFVHAGVL